MHDSSQFERELAAIDAFHGPHAPMRSLDPKSEHHLNAAEGWLGLGNWVEADEELAQIKPKFQEHPQILELRLEVYSAGKKWQAALETATALIHKLPKDPFSWLNRS